MSLPIQTSMQVPKGNLIPFAATKKTTALDVYTPRARALASSFSVNLNAINISEASKLGLKPEEIRGLITDSLESMWLAQQKRHLPRYSNDCLGAVVTLKSGKKGGGINIEPYLDQPAVHYICAEINATNAAILGHVRSAPVSKKKPVPFTPGVPMAVPEGLQIKSLTLARWPEKFTDPGSGKTQDKPCFTDPVQPCILCESWMATGTFYRPETVIAYLERDSETGKISLKAHRIYDRLPYMTTRHKINLSPQCLNTLKAANTKADDYILSKNASSVFSEYRGLYSKVNEAFKVAALRIEAHETHVQFENRKVSAAVILSNGKVSASSLFEYKGRWVSYPAITAATKAIEETEDELLILKQKLHKMLARQKKKSSFTKEVHKITRDIAALEGTAKSLPPPAIVGNRQATETSDTTKRPYIVGIVFLSNDPAFSPSTIDLGYLARPYWGGPNIMVATLQHSSSTNHQPKIHVTTFEELHPYHKRVLANTHQPGHRPGA